MCSARSANRASRNQDNASQHIFSYHLNSSPSILLLEINPHRKPTQEQLEIEFEHAKMLRLYHLIAFLAILSLGEALQFCRVEAKRTNLCFAVASYKNHTTKAKDVSLHFSAGFEGRNGWAAIGIGLKMAGSLMVVMYPGDQDGGEFLYLFDFKIKWHRICVYLQNY